MEQAAKDLHLKLSDLKKENTKLYYDFFEELDHGDTLHLAVYNAFKKIFKALKK